MAPRPPKPCKKAGCKTLTVEANGYCKEHQQIAKDLEIERRLRGDRGRESSYKRGYGKAWVAIRKVVLRQEPLCRECSRANRITLATCVHHKDENAKNNSMGNLVPLCFDCHERIHGRKK